MAEFRIAPGGYVSPIDGTIADNSSGTFGASRASGGRKHAGNDFQTPTGSPALAVVGGKVIYVGDNQGYRHNAVVLGDDGNAYRYATHKSIDVKLGQRVEQGQKIGAVGGLNGGRSHLHFEVIPPTSPAFRKMVANPGQFVSTQWFPGGPPLTTDPAKVLGVNYGDRLIAGKILPNPDPFGVDRFNQNAATATGFAPLPHLRPAQQAVAASFPAPPLPNLRPKEPYAVVRQRLTDMADAGRAAQARAPGSVPNFNSAQMAFAGPNPPPPAQQAIATRFPNVSKFGGAESLRAPTSFPYTASGPSSMPQVAAPSSTLPPPSLAPQQVAASDTPLPNMRPRGFDARNVVDAYRTGGEPAVAKMVGASSFRSGGTADQTFNAVTENEKKARAWITAAEAGAKLTQGGLSAGAAVQSTANDALNAAKGFFSQFGGTKAPPQADPRWGMPSPKTVYTPNMPTPPASIPQRTSYTPFTPNPTTSYTPFTPSVVRPQPQGQPPQAGSYFPNIQTLTPSYPRVDHMNLTQGQQAAADRLTALAAAYGKLGGIPFTLPPRTVATLPPRQSVQQVQQRPVFAPPSGTLPLSAPAGGGYVSSPSTFGGVAYISGAGTKESPRIATNSQGATIRLS